MKKILASLLFAPMMAHAEFYTGNELYMKMIDANIGNQMFAMGYVAGVYDVGVHMFFCPGSENGITVGQVTDMAKNWLYSNAARRNESAQKLVTEAFRQAWPCPKQNNGRGA